MIARRLAIGLIILGSAAAAAGQDLLGGLGAKQDFRSRRVSSYDRTGGNRDAISIQPGETAVLAEIRGPAAIHHIWTTVAAEPFYGRKIVLRIHWDGEETPSVEAPIGDFFGVGHGLDRNLVSLPIVNSSEGRARNCYWPMPFRRSCRITATNEGDRPVAAFYYYIDYRELEDIPHDAPYFHAQYRQEFPCGPGENYLLLDAAGAGHYVGCNLSVLQRAMGWWGEGDDMIYVDGEETPSLHGTGSEDYFSDAWGMREGLFPFYGCPLQEADFQAGAKAAVYRFHIPDPIPFEKAIRVAIEHGHANDRADNYASVAYWYQTEPHLPFPPLPPVGKRLPFALEAPENFVLPAWEEAPDEPAIAVASDPSMAEAAGAEQAVSGAAEAPAVYTDSAAKIRFTAPRLSPILTSFYDARGERYPALATDGAVEGTRAELTFAVPVTEGYAVDLYFLQGPARGNVRILAKPDVSAGGEQAPAEPGPADRPALGTFEGYASETAVRKVTLDNLLLIEGDNVVILEVAGRDDRSAAMDLAFVGLALRPAERRFATEWNLIGPFDAPDMDSLYVPHPPEQEIDLAKTYAGKGGTEVGWRAVAADRTGYVRLNETIEPAEYGLVYALTWVFSPDDRDAHVLLGADDGVRLWANDRLVHTNPAYRAAAPDQDTVAVRLARGWNKVLIKVLQGAGGWGYYLRIADPAGDLRWAPRPEPEERRR